MKLCLFQQHGGGHDHADGRTELGVVVDGRVRPLSRAWPELLPSPAAMPELIGRWPTVTAGVQMRLDGWAATGVPELPLDQVRLLAPIPRPGKILGIGLNYLAHVQERIVGESRTVPEHQVWFPKAITAVNGPFDPIVLPGVSNMTDYEAELVVVIGQRCRHVPRERAHEVVFGYCVGNDVSVRDFQKRTSQWTLGKSFDTHAPFGPWLTTADELGDPHTLDMRCWINGELRQHSNTSLMIHDIWSQIAVLSQVMTLEPGDLIYTGTCSGVGAAFDPPKFLTPGDEVKIEIERLGAIRASCVAEDTSG